jgi:hypothetical protein
MSQTFGKTRWKRFAVVMVPSVAATAVIGVSMAQGALAASFSIAGQSFKVSADTLHGTGFGQYGTVDVAKNGKQVPVAVSSFKDATIHNLCQSVPVQVPVLGTYTMKIQAGGGSQPVTAKNLFIDMTDLKASQATFNNINIGVAAGAMTKGSLNPQDKKVDPNSFAQESDSADLSGVKQTAWATSAGTFALAGMHLSMSPGAHDCF